MGALSFIHTTLQNAAVLPEYQSFSTTTQRNAVHLKYLSTSHCSSWCSDGNLGTATYNTDAVDYEQSFTSGPV